MPLNDTKLIIEGGEGGVKKRLTTACNLTRTQCSSKWVQEQNDVRLFGRRARQNLVLVRRNINDNLHPGSKICTKSTLVAAKGQKFNPPDIPKTKCAMRRRNEDFVSFRPTLVSNSHLTHWNW